MALPNPQPGVLIGAGGPIAAPSGITSGAAGTTPLGVSVDTGKPLYVAANVGVTLYSTAAAVLIDIVGSATKTIRIKTIALWAQAGTKFYTELELLRSTTVSGTGVANSTPTPRPYDINDAAATAVVKDYAAAATSGTGGLLLGARGMYVGAPAATNSLGGVFWDFREGKSLVLRGTGDVIEVYNTVLTLGTATFGYEVTWEEDAS